MGFNTTIIVMNDALHHIEDDKDFGRKLAAAIKSIGYKLTPQDVPSGGHCNAATIIETHHADFKVMVEVGHNYAEVVTEEELKHRYGPKKRKKNVQR
jgi:hypothetical protein